MCTALPSSTFWRANLGTQPPNLSFHKRQLLRVPRPSSTTWLHGSASSMLLSCLLPLLRTDCLGPEDRGCTDQLVHNFYTPDFPKKDEDTDGFFPPSRATRLLITSLGLGASKASAPHTLPGTIPIFRRLLVPFTMCTFLKSFCFLDIAHSLRSPHYSSSFLLSQLLGLIPHVNPNILNVIRDTPLLLCYTSSRSFFSRSSFDAINMFSLFASSCQ